MKVPTIGESITEVTLSQWLKKDGDYVELDEPICEFESDKATLEFPAEAAGTSAATRSGARSIAIAHRGIRLMRATESAAEGRR